MGEASDPMDDASDELDPMDDRKRLFVALREGRESDALTLMLRGARIDAVSIHYECAAFIEPALDIYALSSVYIRSYREYTCITFTLDGTVTCGKHIYYAVIHCTRTHLSSRRVD